MNRGESDSFCSSLSYCLTQWAYWVCQAHCMFLPVFIVNVVIFLFELKFCFVIDLSFCCVIVFSFRQMRTYVCICVCVCVCGSTAFLGSYPCQSALFSFRNSYMNGFSFAFHFAPLLIILTCKHALLGCSLHFHCFLHQFSFIWNSFAVFFLIFCTFLQFSLSCCRFSFTVPNLFTKKRFHFRILYRLRYLDSDTMLCNGHQGVYFSHFTYVAEDFNWV